MSFCPQVYLGGICMFLLMLLMKLMLWGFIALVVLFAGMCFLGLLGFIWEIIDIIRGKK